MNRRDFSHAAIALMGGLLLPRRASSLGKPEGGTALDAAAYHRLRRHAHTWFGRIAYIDHGRGPAALFIHGFPLSGFQWRHALGRLGDRRRCLAPDLMGLGYTEVSDDQDLTPGAQARMLASLLDRLSISEVDLVANDSGGTIAQIMMALYPHRIRSVILTDRDVNENSPPAQMRNSIQQGRNGTYDKKIERHLDDRDYARSANGIGGNAYSDPASFSDEAIEYSLRPLVASQRRHDQLNRYLAAFEPNPLVALRGALGRFEAPSKMLWGTSDPLFPVS